MIADGKRRLSARYFNVTPPTKLGRLHRQSPVRTKGAQ
jgi:hypothetical protein